MNLIAAFHVEVALAALALATLVLSSIRAVDAKLLGRGLAAVVFGLFVYSVALQQPDLAAEGGVYRIDEYALLMRQLGLVTLSLVLLLAAEFSGRARYPAPEQYSLLLLASTGMLVLCTARDFVLLFVALELLTTASYVLVAFPRNEVGRVEASVKYLTMGALSTALIAYGISFVFGTTGSTSYDEVREVFTRAAELSPTQALGVAFVLAAFAFKLAAVPGHMWAPDVYQGASLPVTAFLATGSKIAGFAAFVRLVFDPFSPLKEQLAPVLLVVAGATVVWGSFGALRQTDLRRMIGYSSITHTGYLVFAAVSGTAEGATAIQFYLVQYVFSSLAFFFALGFLTRSGRGYSVAELRGLNRDAPWLSWMMAIPLVSLTGVPPLSGFIGKYLVLAAVPDYAEYAVLYFSVWALALIAVVVSVVFYFGVIRTMWLTDDETQKAPIASDRTLGVALGACVACVVLLGVFPYPALTRAMAGTVGLGLGAPSQVDAAVSARQ